MQNKNIYITNIVCMQYSWLCAHGNSSPWYDGPSSTLAAWLLALAYICLSIRRPGYWFGLGWESSRRVGQTELAGCLPRWMLDAGWTLVQGRNRHGCNWLALVWLHSRSSRRRSRGNRTLVPASLPSVAGSANGIANAIAIAFETSVCRAVSLPFRRNKDVKRFADSCFMNSISIYNLCCHSLATSLGRFSHCVIA